MLVSEWMTHPVHTVKPHDNAMHARELVEVHRINQLPVTKSDEVVGIVSDRDLRDAYPSVFESAAEGTTHAEGYTAPDQITIESIMSPNVLTVTPDTSLVEAARLMRTERIGALPVVENGKIRGILARSNVIEAFLALAGSGDDER